MLKHRTIASLFILIIIGCNVDRSINYDELISIKYVKGEELPYTGSSIEKYENGHKSYEVTYKDGEKMDYGLIGTKMDRRNKK